MPTTRMAQLNTTDIPQEIVDEIIDHFSGDRTTLLACSLTSRAWVHRSRKYLFAKLTLTGKTLPVWCGEAATPTPTTGSLKPPSEFPQDLPPPTPPSYSLPSLPSYVTSLALVTTYSKTPLNIGSPELFRAQSFLSAFTQLKSLSFGAVSFVAFDDASLERCLGSLRASVRELRLSSCYLDEGAFFAFLRLFDRLESLELDGNVWVHNRALPAQCDPPTLRCPLTASGFSEENGRFLMLYSLARVRLECQKITIGDNHRCTIPKFNDLFLQCKDHLTTLIFTTPESNLFYQFDRQRINFHLSPCHKLVEIHGRFHHAQFEVFTVMLGTVQSPRFRKLSIFISPPIPPIRPAEWGKLDAAVIELVKRVNTTDVSDKLEVLFSSYFYAQGGTQLSEIEGALPLAASDARVSLRTEYIALPSRT